MRPGAARLLFPALRWSVQTGYEHESARIEQALRHGVGGFCIFGGTAEGIADLTYRTQSRCDHALLFGADLERGAGQQFDGATPLPPLGALGALDDLAATRAAAALTAREARALGINWVYGPVADLDLEPDNPIVGTRAFGADPEQVSAHVRAWVEGCRDAGALSCAKHFPGHGRTVKDSHAALPLVDASRAELERDLAPFRAAIAAGVDSVMTAHVAYPALDPHARAATLSSRILRDLLRGELGFEGLVATDAVIMQGLLDAAGGDEADAAVAAMHHGCDVILYPDDLDAVAHALNGAVGTGLERARVEASLERLREYAERAQPRWGYRADPQDAVRADELAVRCIQRIDGVPACPPNLELLVVDDDLGGPYPPPSREPFAAALAAHGVATEPVREAGGMRPLLLAVFADVRAWKERAGLSSAASAAVRAALQRRADATVVVFGHPRTARAIGAERVVCAWGGEPIMQRAAAAWLARHAQRTVL